jgi:DNA-binding LytR/AlgR family response regulator
MKVLIIEDELLAQAKLELMLKEIDPSITVLAKLASVKDALDWLAKNASPDIAFVDIQLADDHSFEIFRRSDVRFPVIFTTAYDKYLLESFEFNSIDYVLKPILEDKLKRALEKFKKLEQHFFQNNLLKLIHNQTPATANRIVVKKGGDYLAIDLSDIAYFYTDHRIVFARDFTGKQFITDKNLAELEASLDQQTFFRINRKFIANIKAVEKFKPDNGKIRIFLKPELKEQIHVSKETAPVFRKWIGVED